VLHPHTRVAELTQLIDFKRKDLSVNQIAAVYLGAAYILGGRVADALSLSQEAVAQMDSIGRSSRQAFNIVVLSEARLHSGDPEEALTYAERALDLSRTYKERGYEAYALRLLGDIAMHRNPPEIEPAETHYQQALALADELGMRPLQAHCHRGLGTLYSQTGQPAQACAELSRAIDMYRDMAMTFWLPETEEALAELEG
jgi:tetratricopeptide (TPR) repeat protein